MVRVSPARAIERTEELLDLVASSGRTLDDRPVYQARPGPNPRFDTVILGEEQPLVPSDDGERAIVP